MSKERDNNDFTLSLPLSDVSLDTIGLNSTEAKGMNSTVLDGAATKLKLLGGFEDVRDLKLGPIGINEGKDMLNALANGEEVTTASIMRAHLLKIAVTFLLLIFVTYETQIEKLKDVKEAFDQIIYITTVEATIKAVSTQSPIGFVRGIIEFFLFKYYILSHFPQVVLQEVYNSLILNTPSGLSQFKAALPLQDSALLPQSIALILKINNYAVQQPPEVPQPYLDADKKVQIPNPKEVQYVLSLRNEYFTQQRAHMAAERVRLLSEIGRFVTWSALLLPITSLNIYEHSGTLWSWDKLDTIDMLREIGNSILSELSSFSNGCSEAELEDIRSMLPKITLVEVVSGKSYSIQDGNSEAMKSGSNGATVLEEASAIESLISSYSDRKELFVYLTDHRARTSALEDYAVKKLKENEKDEIEISSLFPPSTDLVIISGRGHGRAIQTLGYVSSQDLLKFYKEAVVYNKPAPFSFGLFRRSLFYFIKETVSEYEASVREEERLFNSNESILSYAVMNSTDYLARFYRRFKDLRFFDLNSSNSIEN